MTTYFAYEELTWPEVNELARDTPIVIPLGQGYPFDRLASELGNPPRVGLLPAIPFGWRGSGLVVPQTVLAACLANLLSSLQEDGFSKVFALTPQGLDWPAQATAPDNPLACIELPRTFGVRSGASSSSDVAIPHDYDRHKVVMIPIGHTEQHGHHLPLSTDTLIIEAIAQGVVKAAPERATPLPAIPYGVSTHRQAFAGTLNVGGRAFEDFWLEVIGTLVQRGFNHFYLISGHGGNCSFLVNVVKYAGELYPEIFCATAWLYLSGSQGVAALQKHRRSGIGGMGHAGELETSLLLHLRPELVNMERVVDETDFISTPSYYMDWVEGGALVANPPWYDDTTTGAYGAGSMATRANGEIWMQAAIAEKVAHVAEIHEQYERRAARRRSGYGRWGSQR